MNLFQLTDSEGEHVGLIHDINGDWTVEQIEKLYKEYEETEYEDFNEFIENEYIDSGLEQIWADEVNV